MNDWQIFWRKSLSAGEEMGLKRGLYWFFSLAIVEEEFFVLQSSISGSRQFCMIDELKVIRFFPLHLDTADDGSQMPTKADIIGEPKFVKLKNLTQWHRKIQIPVLCQEKIPDNFTIWPSIKKVATPQKRLNFP